MFRRTLFVAGTLFATALTPPPLGATESAPIAPPPMLVPPPDLPPGGGGPPSTAPHMVLFDIDPANNTVDIAFSNGLVITVDGVADTILIAADGQTHQFPIDAMFMAAANGNDQLAASLEFQFNQMMGNSMAEMGIRDTAVYPQYSGGPSLSLGEQGGAQYKQGPGGDTGFLCMGNLRCEFFWDLAYTAYLYHEFGYPDPGPSDPQEWAGWHAAQCGAVPSAQEDYAQAVVAAALSCPFIETPQGGGVCLLSVWEVIDQGEEMGNYIVNCHSSYTPH